MVTVRAFGTHSFDCFEFLEEELSGYQRWFGATTVSVSEYNKAY